MAGHEVVKGKSVLFSDQPAVVKPSFQTEASSSSGSNISSTVSSDDPQACLDGIERAVKYIRHLKLAVEDRECAPLRPAVHASYATMFGCLLGAGRAVWPAAQASEAGKS